MMRAGRPRSSVSGIFSNRTSMSTSSFCWGYGFQSSWKKSLRSKPYGHSWQAKRVSSGSHQRLRRGYGFLRSFTSLTASSAIAPALL